MENLKKFCKEKSIDFFFPIALILTIVPLIVRMSVVNLDEDSSKLYGVTTKYELFSQKKALFLLIFSVFIILLSITFFKYIFEKKDKITNSILIAAIIFIAFTLFSAITSQYKSVSLWGVYDRAEGFITIACYIIIFIYSIYTFKKTENYKFIVIPLIILVCINAFLGLFQYFGQDLIQTELGKLIAIPSEYNSGSQKMDLNLLFDSGKLYGTLFHYNYVGSFVAIVLPILIGSMFFEDDIFYKIVLFIASLCSLWLLIGSTSRGGLVGVVISVIFAFIVFSKQVFKNIKATAIGILTLVILIVGANFATGGKIFARVPSLVSDIISIFDNSKSFDYTEHVPIKNIDCNDGTAHIRLANNEILNISFENNDYVFTDTNNSVLPFVKTDKSYTTTNELYSNISFSIGKFYKTSKRADGILLSVNGNPTFMFKLKDDNNICLIDINNKEETSIEFPETFGFNGKEKIGSARGYIWSRSIPMIKDNLMLGSGPDTFVFEFPQKDYIGKYWAYGTPTMLVDKPHNLYLQILLNDGLIALFAFLAIILIYSIDSLKLYTRKDKYTKSQLIGICTFLGVIGYLFAGFFNDSVVSVAPVFWIVLGTGVSINFINRKSLVSK